jgi:hypothetical protein
MLKLRILEATVILFNNSVLDRCGKWVDKVFAMQQISIWNSIKDFVEILSGN